MLPGLNLGDAGNARTIVLLLDPAAVGPGEGSEGGDQAVAVHLRRVERLALPAVDRVCKVSMIDPAPPLNRDVPRMGL